jgi:hypothetical protein
MCRVIDDRRPTAQQFQADLIVTVHDWCEEEGIPNDGEGRELGDLLRHLEDTGWFDEEGVTLVSAYEEQTLFIVGPDASWLATTGIELGIESESIWQDPLNNLRLDVSMDELRSHLARLRRRADEIAALLGE